MTDWLMRLDGKVVLITGASGGIGAACAAALRARGARLSLTARSGDKLKQVAGPDALFTAGDITDAAVRGRVVERTIERFGAIDVLLNNAGVGLYAPAWKAPLEETRAMFELNVFAPLALTQLAAPHMRGRGGMIVNVGSIAGKVTLPWFTLYSSSKFALGSLSEGLRMELKPQGIQVMLVCPGYVKTQFQENVLGGRPPARLAARRRFAITPEACAEAIVRGIERGARTVLTPRLGWLFVAAARVMPKFVESMMSGMNGQ
ncbi:MAG: SDR family NAD(P)-dependent oxidoreductase [Bryobacteraceae bacterium]